MADVVDALKKVPLCEMVAVWQVTREDTSAAQLHLERSCFLWGFCPPQLAATLASITPLPPRTVLLWFTDNHTTSG